MAERTISIKAFPYYAEIEDPLDEDEVVLVERLARRGETVDFRDADTRRGDRVGAFETAKDPDDEEFEASSASDAELVEWLTEQRPPVNEVIDAADNDPDTARRLIAAEEEATDGNSRATLLSALSKVTSEE